MDTTLVSQITQSGVQYAVEYLGSVPIESSILEMTTDLRVLVVQECIYMLAKEHNMIEPKYERDLNNVAKKVIGNGEVKVRKGTLKAELNIQAKQLRIVSNGAMIGRHPINNVSFASKGQFGNFFGYVAKKADGTDRRCFVMRFPESNVVMRSINEAMRLYAETLIPSVEFYRQQHQHQQRFGSFGRSKPPETLLVSNSIASLSLSDTPTSVQTMFNGFHATGSSSTSETPTNPVFDMYDEPWYQGVINRETAERLLKEDGDFLVRQSTSSPGQAILSCRQGGDHKHLYLIEKGKVKTLAREFPSIKSLIEFHVRTGAMITSNESTIRLIRPISRN